MAFENHHYCVTCKVSIIAHHKLLVEIIKKDAVYLSNRLQRTILQISQDNAMIIFCRLDTQTEPRTRDEDIPGICIIINAIVSYIDTQDGMTTEEKLIIIDDEHLGILSELVLCDWPSTKADAQKELMKNWLIRDEITVMDGTAMKGRKIIELAALQEGTKTASPKSYGYKEGKAAGT